VSGRTFGLDVGSKTIGVAVSDPLGMFAQPVETVQRTGRKADAARIQAIVTERTGDRIVVGLPIRTDGLEGDSAAEARRMAVAIAGVLPEVEVVLIDERYTTAQAERVLNAGNVRGRKKRKKVVDQIAAVLILQQWLDRPLGGEIVIPPPQEST